MVTELRIERKWAMPNKWTFTIPPIKELLEEEMDGGFWIDPFAGLHSPANLTNDLNPEMPTDHHLDALEFLKSQDDLSCDGGLLDPPYSFRQVVECYKGFGYKVTQETTRMDFYSKIKDEMTRVLKVGGKTITFGWNSMGFGESRGFRKTRSLLVPHGGHKNDNIVVVETKEHYQPSLQDYEPK